MDTENHFGLRSLILLLCLSAGMAFGQTFDDWEGRGGVAVEYEFKNGIEISGRYRHYLDHHFSHYKQSGLGLKLDYDYSLNSWLKPGIDYRYKYNGKQDKHDIRYSFKMIPYQKNKFQLEYSFQIQHVIASGINPEFFARNEIELAYEIDNAISLFVFTENYQMIHNGVHFDTQKTGLGAEYDLSSIHSLKLKIDMKNKSDHQDIGRLTLGYTYTIE